MIGGLLHARVNADSRVSLVYLSKGIVAVVDVLGVGRTNDMRGRTETHKWKRTRISEVACEARGVQPRERLGG